MATSVPLLPLIITGKYSLIYVMRKISVLILFFVCAFPKDYLPPWVYGARVATPYDYELPWEEGVKRAVAEGASVILDWSDAGEDWRCLYDPCLSRALASIKRKAEFVHSHFPGVKIIFYVAPLEYVTPYLDMDGDGRVDPGKRALSLSLTHPDWAQIGISGRKSVFFGAFPDMPFWVCPSCEDVWLSPAHTEVRELHLRQAEKLALSGADGLWLDVPFLRGDYGEDWVNQWPDLGKHARDMFHEQTGRSLPAPPFSPDWGDENWLEFVSWRYKLVRDFIREYKEKLRKTNEDFLLAIETVVDYSVFCTQTASDPKDMAEVADLVAHEIGGVEQTAQLYSWLYFISRLLAWRHIDIASGKPSWSLSYVFSQVPELESTVKLHAASLILNGFSYYTSGNETMSGVPSPALRREIFRWMKLHRGDLFSPSAFPLPFAGVVFSRNSLDYTSKGNWETGEYPDGFYGMLMLLLQSHVPFTVIHSQDLDRLPLSAFPLLILPDFSAMDDRDAEIIRSYVESGGKIIATDYTSLYDRWGRPRGSFALKDVFGIFRPVPTTHINRFGKGLSLYCGEPHEKYYFWYGAPWDATGTQTSPEDADWERVEFLKETLFRIGESPPVKVKAPPTLLATFWCSPSGMSISFVNLTGVGWEASEPRTVNVEVELPASVASASYLPFLGSWSPIPGGRTLKLKVRFGGILKLKGFFPGLCNKFLPFYKRGF